MQIGQNIIRLDKVDSTNNYTANLVKEGLITHGTVILAGEQSAGKGQRGAIWTSKYGENLLLSLFVCPDNLSVENQLALSHFTSISLIEILRKIGISSFIKWPNDIYVNGKKIAGILIENTVSEGRILNSIIGIGLNVNQIDFEYIHATSIRKEKGEFISKDDLLYLLLFEFNLWWKELSSSNFNLLNTLYLENLYLINKEALYEDEKGVFIGIIKGIDPKGLLQIQKRNEKELVNYDLKEIKFISQNIS